MGVGELGCGTGHRAAHPDREFPEGGADLRVRDSDAAGVHRHRGRQGSGLSGVTFLNTPPIAGSLCPKCHGLAWAAGVPTRCPSQLHPQSVQRGSRPHVLGPRSPGIDPPRWARNPELLGHWTQRVPRALRAPSCPPFLPELCRSLQGVRGTPVYSRESYGCS